MSQAALSRPGRARLGPATGLIIACTVGNFVCATPMVNSVFGVFLLPLAKTFGWPRAEVSGVLVIVAVVGVLAYPIVGRIADRYGARTTLLIGNLAFAAAVAALSLANGQPFQVYGLFALVGVTAAMSGTVLYSKIVAGWFTHQRGLMLGITAGGGNGAGATLMPGVAALLLTHYGWRAAYVGLGLIILGLGFPILWAGLRNPPSASKAAKLLVESGVSAAEARRTLTFRLMAVAVALGAGSLSALFSHIVAMLMDRHVGEGLATTALMAFAFSGTGWQLVVGHLFDRASTPKIAAPFFLVSIAGVALLSLATGPVLLILGGLLAGLGIGTEYGLLPYALPRYFGLRSYGETYGVIYGLIVLTMGFSPVLMDAVYDRTGNYDLPLIVIGACMALSAALIAVLPIYRYTVHGEALAGA
jgi:MFS family permease